MTATGWSWVRRAGAVTVLALIAVRLGTGPFVAGLRAVNGWSVAAAAGIALITTAACALRWCLVAGGLGVPLRYPSALAAYYRSQFLNGALPGGILGDVHRGVRHGREAGDLGRGLRAVAWERTAGQAVQAGAAAVVLGAVPSPIGSARPAVLVATALAALVLLAAVVAARRTTSPGRARPRPRAVHAIVTDLRDGVGARDRWPGIVATSLVAVAGHATTFVIAARVAGSRAPLTELLPITVLVLLAAAIPANVGGWGPREGAAAWAFAAAGLGAAQGVAAATAYGVLALAGSLPGALVLAAGRLDRRSPIESRPALDAPETGPARVPEPAGATARSAVDG